MAGDQFPRRKPLRLQGYDYSQAGAYFVTICTYQRTHLFGNICRGEMLLSPLGHIAVACWQVIPAHHSNVQIDTFVVMPNHVHGIIVLDGNGKQLGTIVGTYKAAVTRLVHKINQHSPLRIWHTRYHDRIIHNDTALQRIRAYIARNPLSWEHDLYARQ